MTASKAVRVGVPECDSNNGLRTRSFWPRHSDLPLRHSTSLRRNRAADSSPCPSGAADWGRPLAACPTSVRDRRDFPACDSHPSQRRSTSPPRARPRSRRRLLPRPLEENRPRRDACREGEQVRAKCRLSTPFPTDRVVPNPTGMNLVADLVRPDAPCLPAAVSRGRHLPL